jgi:tRNA pseudouridine38-40 synthase
MSPIDILFKEVKIVNDKFHARFSAKYKTYIYLISSIDEIFKRNYQFFYEHKINIIKIKKAMKLFIGNHDFKSFSTSVLDNSIRTISKFNIKKRKHMYVFSITGNGFLRNMVRMILGSLLDINENKKNINDITKLLSNPKKGSSIAKVPGCGLYLKEVKY